MCVCCLFEYYSCDRWKNNVIKTVSVCDISHFENVDGQFVQMSRGKVTEKWHKLYLVLWDVIFNFLSNLVLGCVPVYGRRRCMYQQWNTCLS